MCPFCNPDPSVIFLDTADVFGLWDAFPLSPGHALLVPRRHVASWFEVTPAERAALAEATGRAKEEIETRHAPDGYNIAINTGEAAGQSIFHLHVHVIPRYKGDVPDPRAALRGVIPGKATS